MLALAIILWSLSLALALGFTWNRRRGWMLWCVFLVALNTTLIIDALHR